MILSRRAWLLLAATAAHAQQDEAPRRLILDASRALQGGNAARFMSYFDRDRFAEFPALRRTITALTETRTIASSVDILSMTESNAVWSAQVDWLMQLSPVSGPGSIEQRQQTISLRVDQNEKGAWRITAFAPVEFFRVL